MFGDRLGKLLFKLVVEHNMTNHLLGGDIDMTRDEYNKMLQLRLDRNTDQKPVGVLGDFGGDELSIRPYRQY